MSSSLWIWILTTLFFFSICFVVVFSALLPSIFSLHSPLFLSTIAICAVISIALIVTTFIFTRNLSANVSPNSTGDRNQMLYLRTPSLPSYENVVTEQSCENVETPPPTYNEINFPQWI